MMSTGKQTHNANDSTKYNFIYTHKVVQEVVNGKCIKKQGINDIILTFVVHCYLSK